jgi:hypothetical protein
MSARSILLIALWLGAAQPLAAQRVASAYSAPRTTYAVQRDFFRRAVPHYGKWLTAGGAAVLTTLGAAEHQQSKKQWDQLLDLCHSAQNACDTGPDGRYVRPDAEQLYQRSRDYDRRANHLLLGAQATLLVTTTLFIIDLHPGGPGNIPFPAQMQVGMARNGAQVGMRVTLP